MTRSSSPKRALIGAALAAAFALPAVAGPIGYSAWDVSGTDKLVRFDMASGVGTVIGAIRTAGGTGYTDVDGLAFDGQGRLWGVDDATNTLMRIDTATGAATAVGNMGSNLGANFGLAFGAGGTLYMSADSRLFTVNTSTGAASLVGSFSNGNNVRSLGYDGTTLFGWSSVDTLLAIDGSNAAASTIGGFGFAPATSGRDGMDVDARTGTIWGLGDAEARTYTLNALTGAATVVAQQVCVENNVSNVNCNGGGFNGLAIQAVPEPASFTLAALALLGLGATRRRASAG
ncbi:conserved exported hypothetical protein [Rubrivivax sp. A210]|uniref:DUF6923 family protein n=1 Tax=Rubrivivax sp. A210 TaxID=2772301 RepID=UPI001919F3F1|nr:PEP-CTERM sorting domain-containing protein [Rubrivivax sp. A210]CAD5375275.1 conserved exported hypothetical protein [Rubrivivax sp. A210]